MIDLAGISTSAVALAGTTDGVLWEEAAGEAQVTTRFDYASLTKPFVATLALVLDAEGALPLATRIGEVWPEAHRNLARKSLSDLLRHRSGLADWTPLYHRCESLDEIRALLLGGELLGTRAGTYSDLDYILWGMAAERWTGERLDRLLRSHVLDPLALSSVEPFPGHQPDLAASLMDTGKEADLAARQGISIEPLPPPPLGWPQDGNARFLLPLLGGPGRLAGHAGLFGGARDLWALAAAWLAPRRLLQPEGVAAALGGVGPYALGWQRRTLRGSAGRALSPSSYGLTGFAGNSIWTDPEEGRIFVLLSSRIDPRSDINRWRRRFHARAVRAAG